MMILQVLRDDDAAGAPSPALHPEPLRLAAYVAGSKLRLRTKARGIPGAGAVPGCLDDGCGGWPWK